MKTALLLSTMGGPDSLDNVRPFLFRLFNDRSILRLSQPFRLCLAWLIARRREKEAKETYRKMGGKSPITANTKRQAEALEKELNTDPAKIFRCFVGMSYAPPMIEDAVRAIKDFAPDRIILLPLYPQFSTTTTASVLRDAKHFLNKNKITAPLFVIERFYSNEGFLRAMCDTIRAAIEQAARCGEVHVLFSAHGLPESIVRSGDPYQTECEATTQNLVQRLGLKNEMWTLCYQSRVGPMQWIGPETKDVIAQKARQGKALVIVPIAFVCEHSETLVELAQDYRLLAQQEGASAYEVAATVGTKKDFIQGLAEEIRKINQE